MQPIEQVDQSPVCFPGSVPLSRIMSVDDETVDQMLNKRVIRRGNLSEDLICCTTGAAALSFFANPASPPVDLILLDVNMPLMNGFEFLEAAAQLSTLRQVPPVLMMLTTPLGPVYRRQAARFEMIKGYLDKPLTLGSLKQAISELQTA